MKDSIGKFLIIAIMFLLTMLIVLTGCEKQEFTDIPERSKPDVSMVEKFCCDWDAANFQFEFQGHTVNQLYFTNSSLCNDELCVYY